MPELLLICRANICRSPLAEGLMRKLIQEGDYQRSWSVRSAGTWTMAGKKADPYVLTILEEKGLDLEDHRSREVTGEMIRSADLVLTMEGGQAEALRVEFPHQAGKIHQISELTGDERDVKDPVKGTEEDFRQTGEEIEGYLRGSEEAMLGMIEG